MKYRIQLRCGHAGLPRITHPTVQIVNTCKDWCKETLGTGGWNYYGMYRKIPFEFRFKRAEDMLAFKLIFGEHCKLDIEENIV